jgi:CRP/FNR family cyclic AMP-dependent transcriptional regulator
MVDAALLSKTRLFEGLPEDAVAVVAASSATRRLRRHDVVFRQDDDADELFVVLDGRIAIAKQSADGRESVVALMEQGDVFGEFPLFDGLGRSAEARALEDSTITAVPYAAVRRVFEDEPALLWRVVELLAERLRATDAALADSVFLDVPGRTAKRLLELAGSGDEFQLPITQEELASMVGASRERVNKAISSFVRLGWIEQSERRYRILNREQLARRSQ